MLPEWADVVKLGKNKKLAPIDPGWYYVRTASIARRLIIRSPTGIGAIRKVYGVAPNHFSLASGSVIRKVLKTLEGLKWAEKSPDGGRKLTKQGRKNLNRIASQLRHAGAVEKVQ